MQRQTQDGSRWLSLTISALGLLLSIVGSWEVGSRAGQEQAVENARVIATLQQRVAALEADRERLLATTVSVGRIEGLLEELRSARR